MVCVQIDENCGPRDLVTDPMWKRLDSSENFVEYNHAARGDSLKRAPVARLVDGSSKKLVNWGLRASHSNGARFFGKGYSLSYTRDRPWALMAIDFSSIHEEVRYFFARLSFGTAANYVRSVQQHFVSSTDERSSNDHYSATKDLNTVFSLYLSNTCLD